jgi:hypothetical protein
VASGKAGFPGQAPRLLEVPALVRHEQAAAVEDAEGDEGDERRDHHDAGRAGSQSIANRFYLLQGGVILFERA